MGKNKCPFAKYHETLEDIEVIKCTNKKSEANKQDYLILGIDCTAEKNKTACGIKYTPLEVNYG